jgi:hypothetical protein
MLQKRFSVVSCKNYTMEGLMNKGIRNGVNQAGKADSMEDEQIRVRFQNRHSNPMVLLFMQILNAFGDWISPIKDDKKNKG